MLPCCCPLHCVLQRGLKSHALAPWAPGPAALCRRGAGAQPRAPSVTRPPSHPGEKAQAGVSFKGVNEIFLILLVGLL